MEKNVSLKTRGGHGLQRFMGLQYGVVSKTMLATYPKPTLIAVPGTQIKIFFIYFFSQSYGLLYIFIFLKKYFGCSEGYRPWIQMESGLKL
jgi:hypothetical protein